MEDPEGPMAVAFERGEHPALLTVAEAATIAGQLAQTHKAQHAEQEATDDKDEDARNKALLNPDPAPAR